MWAKMPTNRRLYIFETLEAKPSTKILFYKYKAA